MATINASTTTILDHAKRMDPDGSIAAVAEMLAQDNQILDDMQFKEGNLPTGMRSTLRTALPGVGHRRYNEGTAPTKSRTGQTEDATCLLEAWAQHDHAVLNLNGNSSAFRLSETMAFIQALNQEMAGTLVYGNSGTAPEEIDGLATRYAASTGTNGDNVLKAGGAGADNTSIWLVCWGDNCHGIFPKGSMAGLQHKSYEDVVIQNAGGVTGALMSGAMDKFTWEYGLHIRNWQYVVRIANIDVSALIAEAADADLTKFMTRALHRIPSFAGVRAAFYMNRVGAEWLDIQRQERVQTGGQLSYKEVDGKWVNTFRDIPIRTVDQILTSEATVA